MQPQFSATFIGLLTVDLQFLTDRYPPANSKVKADDFLIGSGGPATNAAVTFSVLNTGANLITSIGSSSFTGMIHDDLVKYGINVRDLSHGDIRMPIFAAAVTAADTGERTIFSYHPPQIPLDSIWFELGPAPDLVMCDGFYIQQTLEILQEWKDDAFIKVMDAGSWKEGTEKLLSRMDMVICSENFIPPGCNSLEDVIAYLQSFRNLKWAVTRGAKPVIAGDGNKIFEVPVPQVKVVDTLGAGDVFHGAFCYYYLRSEDFEKALSDAAEDASRSCQYFGARNWMEK